MLEHFKGDEELVSKIEDYAFQAEKGKLVLTKFLNPHEREVVRSVIGHSLQVVEDGGFTNAESKRVIIAPDYYEILPEDFKIKVFEVGYNDSFGKLAHSDVLGALMHLGMDRSILGDIADNPLSFAVCDENSDYVRMNLTKIKRSSIHLHELSERVEIKVDFTTKRYFVSSLRLDKILASFFHLSRTKALEAINRGDVKVNFKVNMQGASVLKDGDMISLRHYGRVKLKDLHNTTRQGNHIVDALYYR